MNKFLICLPVLTSLFASAVQAQEAPTVTGNIGLTTKYKYRGQDQSDTARNSVAAVQGGFDFADKGFYIGNWNSSIGFGGGTEVDLYGGFKGELSPGFGFDVGLLQYLYPSVSALNTTEIYGGLNYGIAAVKLSYVMSDKYFGAIDSRGTLYLDFNMNFEIAKNLTLNAHVGETKLASGSAYGPSYSDYKLGATYGLTNGFSVSAAYVGANKRSFYGDLNKPRAVFSISKTL